jgi:hypothetical protein
MARGILTAVNDMIPGATNQNQTTARPALFRARSYGWQTVLPGITSTRQLRALNRAGRFFSQA